MKQTSVIIPAIGTLQVAAFFIGRKILAYVVRLFSTKCVGSLFGSMCFGAIFTHCFRVTIYNFLEGQRNDTLL
jgi:hypothetical protein